MDVREDDPTAPALAALMAEHVAFGRANTPAANAHVLEPAALKTAGVTFWTAWDGDVLLGMVALKEVDRAHGEVKSMRTVEAARGRGVGRALLDNLIAAARARGYRRLSLETGTAPAFSAANRLYERAGFADGSVFGGYPESPHNRFMTLLL